MKIPNIFLSVSLFLGIGAHAAEKSVVTQIKDAQGKVIGTGTFTPAQPKGVKLDLDIKDMPPGDHAFHIHQKAKCEASEDFDTAGLQYDPTGEMYGSHGHQAHSGASAGDPRMMVKVAADRSGRASVVFPALTMGSDDHSIVHGGGKAIIFHAAAGASGPPRIACGIIGKEE